MIRFINEQSIAGETYVRFPVLEFSGAIDSARLRIAFKGKIIKGYNIIPESQARDPGKYRIYFNDDDGGSGYVEEMVFPSFLYADDDPPVVLPIYSPMDDMTEVWFRKSDMINLGLLSEESVKSNKQSEPHKSGQLIPDRKKISLEDVVRSVRDPVLCICKIIGNQLSNEDALAAAVSFLKKNPCEYLPVEKITEDIFSNVNAPYKSFRVKLVNLALLHAGYPEKLTYPEVTKLFK